jgi:hypothetical protein
MFIQSENGPVQAPNSPFQRMIRQNVMRFGEKIMRKSTS